MYVLNKSNILSVSENGTFLCDKSFRKEAA